MNLTRFWIILGWAVLLFGILLGPELPFFSKGRKEINVFTWGDILSPEVIETFEKKTKIKVNLNYYASNEELLVKLKATKGKGYDLIIPSDYAVKVLVEEELLKPLDPQKLNFLDSLNPLLLHHDFDKENQYSVPFAWEVYGFGIDKGYFEDKPLTPTLKWIFEEKERKFQITMINDPFEAIFLAAEYLYGPMVHFLDSEQRGSVKELLVTQKSWITAYTTTRGDYFLATKNCPVVVASSSYIWRSMQKFPFIDFVIPEGRVLTTIESMAIPKASHKEELVYTFLNFLFQKEILIAHYNFFGIFPPTLDALDSIKEGNHSQDHFINEIIPEISEISFFRRVLPEKEMREMWVEVKTD